jgi:hypothetical protein
VTEAPKKQRQEKEIAGRRYRILPGVLLTVVTFAWAQVREPAKATDRLTAPIAAIEPTAPGSHTYQLAMSKNTKLCQHMLKLFNDDLARYGYEQYREHKEFNTIPWRKAQFSHENHGRIEYTSVQGAIFDINNDGVTDFVVKWEASLSGILRDNLYVLSSEAASRADKLVNRELFDSKNKISSGWVYRLDPRFTEKGEVFGILEPFVFDSKTYIYMRPLFELAPRSKPMFSVIARYSGGRLDNIDRSGKIDGLCYFKRIRAEQPSN